MNKKVKRDSKGRFAKVRGFLLFMVIVGLVYGFIALAPAVTPQKVAADEDKEIDLNTDFQAFVERRTQANMKKPENIKWYHDQMEKGLNDAVHGLTSTHF